MQGKIVLTGKYADITDQLQEYVDISSSDKQEVNLSYDLGLVPSIKETSDNEQVVEQHNNNKENLDLGPEEHVKQVTLCVPRMLPRF